MTLRIHLEITCHYKLVSLLVNKTYLKHKAFSIDRINNITRDHLQKYRILRLLQELMNTITKIFKTKVTVHSSTNIKRE